MGYRPPTSDIEPDQLVLVEYVSGGRVAICPTGAMHQRSMGHTVWAPHCGSDEVIGLAAPPADAEAFIEFGNAVFRSHRIAALLAT